MSRSIDDFLYVVAFAACLAVGGFYRLMKWI